jgi:hypothetical protein|tara:strand:+ start:1123 stop:1311 length:189 start_codon:yes stop_codon:yes gene_type:complete
MTETLTKYTRKGRRYDQLNYWIRKIKRLVQCKRKRQANDTYLMGVRIKDFETALEVKKGKEG